MAEKQEQTVEVELNIGKNLRAQVRQAAKSWGVSEQEFIHNALESRVRQESDHQHSDSFVRHGGKHLFGKHTGYEVTPDGKYYPAPTWVEQFEQLWAEQGAIQTLVNGVVAVAQERLVVVQKAIQKTKNDLVADIGLDPAKTWVYYGGGKNYLAEVPDTETGKDAEPSEESK